VLHKCLERLIDAKVGLHLGKATLT
jgi:hypothetical protein